MHQEPWTLDHGWTRGYAHLRILGGANQVLHADATGWTDSTPAGGAPWTPAQVKAELQKQGLEGELRAFGLWNFGN